MKQRFIWLALIAATGGVMSFWSCNSNSTSPYGSSSSNTGTPTQNTVNMAGMAFSPTGLTVTKGTTVTWKNNDSVTHTSTSDTGDWDTGNIPAGGSKTTIFNNAGTFKYHCTLHPGMTATIVVQ